MSPCHLLIDPAIGNTNLVVESDVREAHLHQPLEHGHLQVEVFGKLVHGGTGAQLKETLQVHHLPRTQFILLFIVTEKYKIMELLLFSVQIVEIVVYLWPSNQVFKVRNFLEGFFII